MLGFIGKKQVLTLKMLANIVFHQHHLLYPTGYGGYNHLRFKRSTFLRGGPFSSN